jgi:hypothetical protein
VRRCQNLTDSRILRHLGALSLTPLIQLRETCGNVDKCLILRPFDAGRFGMTWVRSNIKCVSRIALFALVIQIALSFGHFHALDGTSSEHGLLRLVAATAAPNGSPNHPADRHDDCLCPICMAATAIGHALASASPALPIEFAQASIDCAIESGFGPPDQQRSAFQSRAPPIS